MVEYTVIALVRYEGKDFLRIVEAKVEGLQELRDHLNILEASELVVDFSVYVPLGHERVGMEDVEGMSGYKKWSHKD